MISKLSVVSVMIKDYNRALDFYTNKLGFEKRMDMPMGEEARWLTVAPAGAETEMVLYKVGDEEADRFGHIVFECADIAATHQELAKNGVIFSEEPTQQPWGGIQAQFQDLEGNTFVLVQR